VIIFKYKAYAWDNGRAYPFESVVGWLADVELSVITVGVYFVSVFFKRDMGLELFN
jgi:hypothetical protein